jgi:hypothetical protein
MGKKCLVLIDSSLFSLFYGIPVAQTSFLFFPATHHASI